MPPDLFSPEQAGPNPLMMVHRALRGRYLLAGAAAVVLGLPGAVLGYMATKPKFTSTAVLEAAPTLPALLYENELNESLPAFEAFVAQQSSELQSERVLTNALSRPTMVDSGWPTGSSGLIRLRESLAVSTPKRTNQIILSVSDHDPSLARAAAKSIIESYEAIRSEYEATTFGQREQNLERLRDEYLKARDDNRRLALDRALSIAGVEDLQAAQQAKLEELTKIEDQIAEVRAGLRALEMGTEAPVLLPEDPELAALQRERMALQRTLDTMLQRFTPEHRECKRLTADLRATDALIESREAELRGLVGEEPAQAGADRRETLRARLSDLEKLRSEAETQIRNIARARLDVLAVQQRADEAHQRFEDAERRLESLRVEKQSQIVGRVRVAQEPERPLRPSTDRRNQLAALGLLMGACAGAGLVAGFGLVFPRLRVADDVSSSARDFALLGMVPEFKETEEHTSNVDIRDSLHFIRVMLDARTPAGCLVAGITSPSSGDGKTTISLLLARSFAMTKRRVLLIDADLVGRGLSRMLNIEPRDQASGPEPSLDDLIVPIEGGRIHFVPASKAESASDSFCRHVLQRLLRHARAEYDVVLLDTGPILGSIEAAAMVPVVDQMLLVAARGLESRLLRMATQRLRDLGASSVGIVFNKAETVDFIRSFSPVSSVSRRHSDRAYASVLPPMLSADETTPGETPER